MAETALEILRPLPQATATSQLDTVARDFALVLGADHYAFEVVDRELARHPVWCCGDSCGWWHELAPDLQSLLEASLAPDDPGASHGVFGIDHPAASLDISRQAWLRRFDVRYGMALSVEALEPGSVAANMALAFSDTSDLHEMDHGALRALLHHAAALLLDTYMRLPRPLATGEAKLSAREIECLRWASVGKTSGETASILEVRERTVNFHLANTFVKLNVNNKQAAVAQAILRRLI